jgi:hypothetical protein
MLGYIDTGIIFACLAMMIAIGLYASRHQDSCWSVFSQHLCPPLIFVILPRRQTVVVISIVVFSGISLIARKQT